MGNRIISNSINPQFKSLRWQLLASYMFVMTAILVISDVFVYEFFARSLYQQLDQRLLNLAQAASHSLTNLKENHQAIHNPQYHFDKDGDLDIPWQNLRQSAQSIEWFDNNKKRLVQSGIFALKFPLQEGFQSLQQDKKLRTLTIATYSYPQGKPILEGFVRASESSEGIEKILGELRWGCYLGGLTALGLIGLAGMWLTRQAFKPIEKSFLQLKQFTADASHELRTPLTAIKTSVEVIQTHPERIHPADADKLQGIVSATKQMTHLVEDLLLLARTDSSLETSSKTWTMIPLEDLLEDVIELLEMKAEGKNISIKLDEKIQTSIPGEPSQLRRLFANLLDNAIKYTPNHGTVTVTIKEVDRFAVIAIQDTGIGIANEHLSLIFNRFWREESARSYQEGTGLGLAIVQAIAQHHGGDIAVNSVVGVGTCFTVRLPI